MDNMYTQMLKKKTTYISKKNMQNTYNKKC